MATIPRPGVVTTETLHTTGLPNRVQVALTEIAGAAREGLLALSIACGLQVVHEIMSADVTAVCGPRGKHDPNRIVSRHGTELHLKPLGGGMVGIHKPRMRTKDRRGGAGPLLRGARGARPAG